MEVVAPTVPVTPALPPTERSSVIVASSVEVNCSARTVPEAANAPVKAPRGV